MTNQLNFAPPPAIDPATLKAQARRRRAVGPLEPSLPGQAAAGCCTYAVGWRNGFACIICMCCGLDSFNPVDIENRYCGFCHEWHSEWVSES